MIVRELITVLGFDADTTPLEKANRSVDGLKKAFIAITAIRTVVAGGLVALVNSTADHAVQMSRSAAAVGSSVEEYQRLAHAVKSYGTDIGDLNDTLGQLAQVSRDAMGGSAGGIANFKQLGISVQDLKNKNPQQILMMVADGLKSVEDSTTRLALTGALLGEDSAKKMGPLLMQGADAIRALGDEAIVMNEDGIKSAFVYREAMASVMSLLEGFKRMIGVEAMPILTEWLDGIKEWVAQNRELIKSKLIDFLKGVIAAIKIAGVFFGVLFYTLDKVVDLFGGYEKAIKWATAALVAYMVVQGGLGLFAMVGILKKAVLGWKTFGNTALAAWLKATGPVILAIAAIVAEPFPARRPDDVLRWDATRPALDEFNALLAMTINDPLNLLAVGLGPGTPAVIASAIRYFARAESLRRNERLLVRLVHLDGAGAPTHGDLGPRDFALTELLSADAPAMAEVRFERASNRPTRTP